MIWLKNIIPYRLDAAELTAEDVYVALTEKPFFAPGAQDLYSQGWIAPANHAPDLYAIESQGALLVTLRTDEKILPASVIRREADERAQQIEASEGRKIGRRELREIREAVAAELLPRALTKTTTQRALIDLRDGFVFVESGSASKAENLLSVLRETLGSLPTRLLATKTSPQTAMTIWLQDGAPAGFTLDADAELKFPGDGGAVAKVSRQTLDAEEVSAHLQAGKLVTKLGLSFADRVSFILTDNLHFKRLAMLDQISEEIEAMDAQDQAALFDSTLLLCVAELRGLLAAVIEALGGEEHVSA